MCFTINVNIVREEMEQRFGAVFHEPRRYEPNYFHSAFSLPEIPVITSEDPSRIELYRWGLVPSWIRDSKAAADIRVKTMNARAETVDVKPSFRNALRSSRCLVVSRGFYEWQSRVDGKVPYFIFLKGNRIFAFAGIYDRWTNRDTGEVEDTFSIITTTANPLMEKIHNLKKRMPVILDDHSEKRWLDPDLPLPETLELLRPLPESEMEAYTISRLITKPGVDKNTPELIRPFRYPDSPLLNTGNRAVG